MSKITVNVPAKVIVSGEHAVVHGAPALASTANLFSEISVSEVDEQFIFLSLNSFSYIIPVSVFNAVRKKIDNSHDDAQEFLAENRDAFGLCFILHHVFRYLSFSFDAGLSINIKSPVDPGSGLGFSAGYSAGLLKAFADLNDVILEKQDFEQLVEKTETYFHGTPSGIDQYAVLNGGFFVFEKENSVITPVFSDADFLQTMFLVFTGKPESTTKEAVDKARDYFDIKGIEDFVEVSKNIEQALNTNNPLLFKISLMQNQNLLSKIGVSSHFADELSKDIEQLGGALKITGAGTARGDSVGMMLGWHESVDVAKDFFERRQLPFFSVQLSVPGVLTTLR